jgi:hypothetical protein
MSADGWFEMVMSGAVLAVLVCVLVAALVVPLQKRSPRTSWEGSPERGPVDPRKKVTPSV